MLHCTSHSAHSMSELTFPSCTLVLPELWLLFSAWEEPGTCCRTGLAGTCTPAGISPMCCSMKLRAEELGFGAELVLLELRQELLSTGAAAMEFGDSIMFRGVMWKAGILTVFRSEAGTGMTPATGTADGEGSEDRLSWPLGPCTHQWWQSCRLGAAGSTPQPCPCWSTLPCCHGCSGSEGWDNQMGKRAEKQRDRTPLAQTCDKPSPKVYPELQPSLALLLFFILHIPSMPQPMPELLCVWKQPQQTQGPALSIKTTQRAAGSISSLVGNCNSTWD